MLNKKLRELIPCQNQSRTLDILKISVKTSHVNVLIKGNVAVSFI